MTKPVKVGLAVWIAIAALATWSTGAHSCDSRLLLDPTLKPIRCEEPTGGRIERYRAAALPSPYATEFDRRDVTVAYTADPVFLTHVTGIRGTGPTRSLTKTLLVTPPVSDQVGQRRVARGAKRHGGWFIFTERLAYQGQGGRLGFVIDCATALRMKDRNTTAVAECFAVEEMPRFLHMLDAIH